MWFDKSEEDLQQSVASNYGLTSTRLDGYLGRELVRRKRINSNWLRLFLHRTFAPIFGDWVF